MCVPNYVYFMIPILDFGFFAKVFFWFYAPLNFATDIGNSISFVKCMHSIFLKFKMGSVVIGVIHNERLCISVEYYFPPPSPCPYFIVQAVNILFHAPPYRTSAMFLLLLLHNKYTYVFGLVRCMCGVSLVRTSIRLQ